MTEEHILILPGRVCDSLITAFVVLALSLFLGACAGNQVQDRSDTVLIPQELPCAHITFADGTLISCPDGSIAWAEDTFGWTEQVEHTNEIIVTEGSLTRTDFAYEINPCGDGKGIDQLVYKFYDGQFASWSGSLLTVLGPGEHVTQDEQQCRFLILPNGAIRDL